MVARAGDRIARALALIEGCFGADVVRRLRDHRPRFASPVVSFGSLTLDRATGLGGLPRGHLTEYLVPESSGKTTLLYVALASAQQGGGIVALVDAEGTANVEALLACGVDLAALILARPVSATDALLLTDILAGCRGLDALSLAAIPAQCDLPAGRMRPSPICSSPCAKPPAVRMRRRGVDRAVAPSIIG